MIKFLTVIINDIIEHAEHRIFRAIELASDYSYVNGNTAANNRFVKLPGNTQIPFTPRITDIASIRYVTIYTDSGTKQRSELVRVDQDFMSEYYDTPESGQTAKPKYFANWDMDTIVVAPTPNAVYKFEIGITKKPTGLSSSNTKHGSASTLLVFYYMPAYVTFKFLKAPQDQQVTKLLTKKHLKSLAEQLGKKRRDEYRDGNDNIPIPSANP